MELLSLLFLSLSCPYLLGNACRVRPPRNAESFSGVVKSAHRAPHPPPDSAYEQLTPEQQKNVADMVLGQLVEHAYQPRVDQPSMIQLGAPKKKGGEEEEGEEEEEEEEEEGEEEEEEKKRRARKTPRKFTFEEEEEEEEEEENIPKFPRKKRPSTPEEEEAEGGGFFGWLGGAKKLLPGAVSAVVSPQRNRLGPLSGPMGGGYGGGAGLGAGGLAGGRGVRGSRGYGGGGYGQGNRPASKGLPGYAIALIVLAVIAVLGGGYYFLMKNKAQNLGSNDRPPARSNSPPRYEPIRGMNL